MKYKVQQVSVKETQYGEVKEISVTGEDNITVTGTVWKKQKNGAYFPDYDKIVNGAEIELNAWKNPKGNISFYPPKNASNGSFGASKGQYKTEAIKKAQERKEEGILLSSTARMATDMIVALIERPDYRALDEDGLQEKWEYWRNFFTNKWLDVNES